MIDNKCDKNIHNNKDIKREIISTFDKIDAVNAASHLKSHNPRPFESITSAESSAKIIKRNNESLLVESYEDMRTKSFLRMSLKMNSCFDKKCISNHIPSDISKSHFKTSSSNAMLNTKSKMDKLNDSNICNSCKTNSTKINNCKTSDSEFQTSVKNKRPLRCRYTEKHKEFNCDDKISGIPCEKNDCTMSLVNEIKILKLDSLFQFLNQMRHAVISRELSFEGFQTISDRLLKDKMNIELLLLTEMIVRAQVVQMVKLISKDLSQNKITPPALVSSFLKQYQLLKSLSITYKAMLSEYESTYLNAHKLSFDVINRAYFTRMVKECPTINEQITAGNLNVKFEQLCNSNTSQNERERIKIDYAALTLDFQDQTKGPDIDQKIKDIAGDTNQVVRSLINHSFSRGYQNTKDGCNEVVSPLSSHSVDLYTEILEVVSCLPERMPFHKCSLTTSKSTDNIIATDVNSSLHCGSIYQALENIRPPSISCSSSSNNSNGYNSCVSISSYEDSSEDDRIESMILSEFKLEDAKHFKKPEQDHGLCNEINLNEYKRWNIREKDHGKNHEEIKQFDKLYEQYLAENENLTTNMSVPDYISTLEKADNLQSIIKTLMARYRKNIDMQEQLSKHHNVTVSEIDSGYTAYAKKEDYSNCTSKNEDDFKDDDDFEMDFEELSHTLSSGATTRENLEEFEKFLEGKLDLNRAKTHPNVQALVDNCRYHCNKLYKPLSKEESKRTDSESSETGTYLHYGDLKNDESLELPLESTGAMNMEMDNHIDDCVSGGTNHRSSSETGSSSASTENNVINNNNNNKVCNCCKCEMFGEQNLPYPTRYLDSKERLRNTLKKRRQCKQNMSSIFPIVPVTKIINQPDVDSLVEFINGSDKAGCVTPEVTRSMPRKPKQKNSKSKTKKIALSAQISDPVTRLSKEKFNEVTIMTPEIKQDTLASTIVNNISCPEDNEEKEVYDPVVEDFKKFCSNVVVPKHRKKLLFCPDILIGDLEKR